MHTESHAHLPHPTLDLTPHLTDDQLMEAYLFAPDSPHLNGCGSCRARYDNLIRSLEQIRDDAVSEADRVFTDQRLHDQRDRILRRLERHGHPGEVVMFPNRGGTQQAAYRLLLGPARRWVAGAAVAGLVAGLFLGFAVDRRVGSVSARRTIKSPAALAAVAWQRGSIERPSLAAIQDEQMLIEIEDLITGPHRLLEMRVLDDMTTPPELQKQESVVPR
ncbi:MAG TPA: hypothetical protein VGZ27_16615 [Vicinamibacterales bacterium]|jgi:hypothetical protein|nr:hypothetical protein [Vicinamibacterales bacterium]